MASASIPGEASRAPSMSSPIRDPAAISIPALAARAGEAGAGSIRAVRSVSPACSRAARSTGSLEPLSITITS